MNITEIIKNLAANWGKTPYEINSGDCENFAFDVLEALLGDHKETDATYMLADPFEGEDDEFGNDRNDWPAHYWVAHEGRYYDAECPEGVDCWHDLPIFKKWIDRDGIILQGDENFCMVTKGTKT